MLPAGCRRAGVGSPGSGRHPHPPPGSPAASSPPVASFQNGSCGHPGARLLRCRRHSPEPGHVCPTHEGGPSIGRLRATAAPRVGAHLDLHLVTADGAHSAVAGRAGPRGQCVEGTAGGRQGTTPPAGPGRRAGPGVAPRGAASPAAHTRHIRTGGPAAHGRPRRPLQAGSRVSSGALTVRTQAPCVSP